MNRLVTVASLAMMLACSTAVGQGDQEPKEAERARLNEKRIIEMIRRARADAARRRGGPIRIGENEDGVIVLVGRFPAVLRHKDSIRQALADVRRAVQQAQRTQDPKEIRKQLDHAEKALMKARKELWKRVREHEKTEPESRPKPTSKPTSKTASGVATRKSATRSNRDHR